MKKKLLAILIAMIVSAIAPEVFAADDCVNCAKAVGMAGAAILDSRKAVSTANDADSKATKAGLDASMAKREVREVKSDVSSLEKKIDDVSEGNVEVQKKALETTTKSLEIVVPDSLSSDDSDDEDMDFILPKTYRCPGQETIKVVLGKKITYKCRSPQWQSRRERYRNFRASAMRGSIDDHGDASRHGSQKGGNTWLAIGAGLGTFAVLTASGAIAGYYLGQQLYPESLTVADNGNGTVTTDYSAGGSENFLGIGLATGAGLGVLAGAGIATLVYASGLGAEE